MYKNLNPMETSQTILLFKQNLSYEKSLYQISFFKQLVMFSSAQNLKPTQEIGYHPTH